MSVAVLIPWRAGCPHRHVALQHVRARYELEHPDWQLIVGRYERAGAWVKAAAITGALERTNAEVLVLADADVWTEGLAIAVARVQSGAAWTIAHRGVQRLTRDATARFIAGDPWPGLDLDERAYLGVEGGGITVVRRDVYDACPLDPRFTGWGSEDESWGFALRTLHGAPWRGKPALVHLWHPPQPRATRARGSLKSWELRKRYARALGNPTAMRSIIEEARHDAHSAAQPPDDPCAALGAR